MADPGVTAPGNQGMDPLFHMVKGRENAKLYFTPGDMDWDNSGKEGLRMVRELEEQVEALERNNFV